MKKYGLSQSEINELVGIKRDGSQEIKKVKKELKEAMDELEEMKRGDSSNDSDSNNAVNDGLEDNEAKKEKSAYRRRGKNKNRYVCKFNACGQRVKVDHCLCARLILAGSLSVIILAMFYILWSLEKE